MRAAGHHHFVEGEALLLQRPGEGGDCGEELILDNLDSGDMHDRRERVVGGLAVVDVVIGVDRLFAAHHAAGDLNSAVGDDLIGVHVALRAGAGLEHDEGKFGIPFASDDLLGRPGR